MTRNFVALIVMTAGIAVSGCSTFGVGRPVSKVEGEDWVTKIEGNDAYIKIIAEVNPANGFDTKKICTPNFFSRYFTRETSSSILVNINGHANYPIMTVGVSDSQRVCNNIFGIAQIYPIVVVPDNGFNDSMIVTNFTLVDKDNSNLNLNNILSDGAKLAAFTAGPTSGLVTTVGLLSQGAGLTDAQRQFDGGIQGAKTTENHIALDVERIRARELYWKFPIYLISSDGQELHFADGILKYYPMQSIFRKQMISMGSAKEFPKFDKSASDQMLNESINVENSDMKNGVESTTIKKYIYGQYPDRYIDDLIKEIRGNTDESQDALTRFCQAVQGIIDNPRNIALTKMDRTIIKWAMLNKTKAWNDGDGLFDENNDCFTEQDHKMIEAIGLKPYKQKNPDV